MKIVYEDFGDGRKLEIKGVVYSCRENAVKAVEELTILINVLWPPKTVKEAKKVSE